MSKLADKIADDVVSQTDWIDPDVRDRDIRRTAIIIEPHLAPTLALMGRLKEKAVMLHDVLSVYNTHKLGEFPERCDLCAIHADYEAWEKEQG